MMVTGSMGTESESEEERVNDGYEFLWSLFAPFFLSFWSENMINNSHADDIYWLKSLQEGNGTIGTSL